MVRSNYSLSTPLKHSIPNLVVSLRRAFISEGNHERERERERESAALAARATGVRSRGELCYTRGHQATDGRGCNYCN